MSETTKKPAPRRSRAKPKTAPKARSDAGTPLCAVFTAGPTTIRTGPGRGFEAAGEAAAGDWLLALPAKDGWSEVAAVAGGAFIRGYVPESSFSKHGKPASRTRAYPAACRAAGTEVRPGPDTPTAATGRSMRAHPLLRCPAGPDGAR